jgi:hypothetical protein
LRQAIQSKGAGNRPLFFMEFDMVEKVIATEAALELI